MIDCSNNSVWEAIEYDFIDLEKVLESYFASCSSEPHMGPYICGRSLERLRSLTRPICKIRRTLIDGEWTVVTRKGDYFHVRTRSQRPIRLYDLLDKFDVSWRQWCKGIEIEVDADPSDDD